MQNAEGHRSRNGVVRPIQEALVEGITCLVGRILKIERQSPRQDRRYGACKSIHLEATSKRQRAQYSSTIRQRPYANWQAGLTVTDLSTDPAALDNQHAVLQRTGSPAHLGLIRGIRHRRLGRASYLSEFTSDVGRAISDRLATGLTRIETSLDPFSSRSARSSHDQTRS